ncbi:hypothetical protein ES705_30315 [subsurface metagenome]
MSNTFTDKSIKYYRNKLNLRQADLAITLGITATNMSFIENKKLYPIPELAERIAQLLKVPVGALWKEYELELIRQK